MSDTHEEYEVILNRLKQVLVARSDADVARGLDVSTAALSGFKKQRKFPFERLVKFCLARGVSIDWLLTGEGAMRREERIAQPEIVTEARVEYGISPPVDARRHEAAALIARAPDEDVDLVLRLLKHRAEGREIKKLLKEEDGK